jgi:hypothetical protein
MSEICWLVALPALVVDPTADAFVPSGVLLLVGLTPGLVCGIGASIRAFLAMDSGRYCLRDGQLTSCAAAASISICRTSSSSLG